MNAAVFLWLDLAGLVIAVLVALLCFKYRGWRLAEHSRKEGSAFCAEFNQALAGPAGVENTSPDRVALPQEPQPIALPAENSLQRADAELLIKISTLRLRRNSFKCD